VVYEKTILLSMALAKPTKWLELLTMFMMSF